jgi:hypothetical protein
MMKPMQEAMTIVSAYGATAEVWGYYLTNR